MKVVVRKGYVVHCKNRMYGEGIEIPSPILEEVLKNQSWKVEEVKEPKAKEETKEEELKDVSNNRMVDDNIIKKRGK